MGCCIFRKPRLICSSLPAVLLFFLNYLSAKKGGLGMAEEKIGEVVKFFSKPSVAAIKITEGELKVGDTIKITGHTTDMTSVIESMEANNQKIVNAVPGDFIGVKVSDRVRPGDEVFRVVPD
jgi:translation initiation factor IF-2